MRVVFLDIDGVLVTRDSMRQRTSAGAAMDVAAVRRLRRVVAETGARIVVSSTWRLGTGGMTRVREALRIAGWSLPPIIDKTPDLSSQAWSGGVYTAVKRGVEIRAWLERHPDVERFAIVDDDADMLDEQLPHFVQTTFDIGFTDEHAARVHALLSSPDPLPKGLAA